MTIDTASAANATLPAAEGRQIDASSPEQRFASVLAAARWRRTRRPGRKHQGVNLTPLMNLPAGLQCASVGPGARGLSLVALVERIERLARLRESASFTAPASARITAPDGTLIGVHLASSATGVVISVVAAESWARVLFASVVRMQSKLRSRGVCVAEWRFNAREHR